MSAGQFTRLPCGCWASPESYGYRIEAVSFLCGYGHRQGAHVPRAAALDTTPSEPDEHYEETPNGEEFRTVPGSLGVAPCDATCRKGDSCPNPRNTLPHLCVLTKGHEGKHSYDHFPSAAPGAAATHTPESVTIRDALTRLGGHGDEDVAGAGLRALDALLAERVAAVARAERLQQALTDARALLLDAHGWMNGVEPKPSQPFLDAVMDAVGGGHDRPERKPDRLAYLGGDGQIDQGHNQPEEDA